MTTSEPELSPTVRPSSLGYLNNGYENGESGQTPLSARRLPPLDLELLKDDLPKKKLQTAAAKLKSEDKYLSSPEISSPRRYKKKRSKNRTASAESKASENVPGVIVSSESGETNGLELLGENSSTPNSPNPQIVSLGEQSTPTIRPKDPSRKIKVVADIETFVPANEMTTPSIQTDSQMLSAPTVMPRSRSFLDKPDSVESGKPISKSTSLTALHQSKTNETAEDIVDLESSTLSASFTKAPLHPILKHSPDSGSHVLDMFRADSRPSSANSSKPSVRIDDNVTYAGEPSKTPRSSRPTSAKKARPKSASKSHQNGTANGTVKPNQSRFRLTQTTQRKVSPHLKTSVFTMLVCGFFVGAVALYFSLRARKALREGKPQTKSKSKFKNTI